MTSPGAAALLLTLALAGCPGASKPGPVEIKWDRDQCQSCGMVISEPHFAAQLRGGPKGAVAKFDDIGCAAKWLDRQPWASEASTEVWVARHADGQWLDAKTAKFVAGKTSPMGFSFGAADPAADGITFEALREHVRRLDAKH